MKINVGLPDSYLRLGLAIALSLFVADHLFWGIWALFGFTIALALGVTGYARYCPIYAIFGINSCSKNN